MNWSPSCFISCLQDSVGDFPFLFIGFGLAYFCHAHFLQVLLFCCNSHKITRMEKLGTDKTSYLAFMTLRKE